MSCTADIEFRNSLLHLVGNDFVCTPCRLVFTFSFDARFRARLSVAESLSGEDEALHGLSPLRIPRLIFYGCGH
jgi:hypothetical protein